MASFKKQENGKWRCRIRYKKDGHFKEISKSGFKLKSQAEAAAKEMEERLNKGVQVKNSKQTIGNYLQHWMAIKKNQVKPSTFLGIEQHVRTYILPKFKFMPLENITRADCNEWIVGLTSHLRASTIRKIVATFHIALRYAVDEEQLLTVNPLDHIKLPKFDHESNKIKFYTKNQLTTLLDYLNNTPPRCYKESKQYYVLFTLLARTGLRLGEALALNWSDIAGNRLTVDKQIVYSSKPRTAHIATPKTESSYRTILLDPFTVRLLKMHRKNHLEVVLKYANFKRPFGEFQDLIFSGKKGLPLNPQRIRSYLKLACENAGVPQLSPHAFRHTHAVLLLESGANLKVVSERLGHSTIDMTANVYLHVTDTMENHAIEQFANYL